MRILLAHNSLYYPSYGGGDKSNRLLMEALAARGHTVRVVARDASGKASEAFQLSGVEVRVLTRAARLRADFAEQLDTFDPEIILTSTDDAAHLMLEIALRAPRARVVYMVRATIALPFGPDSSVPSEFLRQALRQADGVVAVSEYVAQYARQWGGLDAVHLPISLLDAGPHPRLARFENRFVSMVNPCAVKGISIFLALAARFPNTEFAAVPTWGTTAADLAALQNLPNISVLPPMDDMDVLLRQTRVMLVPSMWAEARSRVILEAMSRGIPVIASDVGGLAEAHLGVDYLLPVNPVVRYRPLVDELMVPVAEIPLQDVRPWETALGRLLHDRAHYEQLSAESRQAALAYADHLNVLPFEAYLTQVAQSPRRRAAPLSNERRRLLALHRKYLRDADDYWFHVYKPQPGDVIVDIGAGRGEDAFAFSRAVGAAGRVWAIEPHPVSFRILRRFCELNRLANVTALNYACLDRAAELEIETLPVWESNYVRTGEPTPTSHPVQGMRFDDLAAEHGIERIDFLKMNVEGAERVALPGCREALRRARFVCVAAHDFRSARGEGEQFRTLDFVRRFLAEAGFQIVTRDDPRYYVPYHVHGFRR